MTWTDWLTLGIALLGAVLGVYNAWQAWQDRAVRFTVHPTQALVMPSGDEALSISVTNRSAFPITIEEVGLTIGKPSGSLPRRAMILPENIMQGSLPMRLDPHHSGSLLCWCSGLPRGEAYDHAYARTSGGEIAFGTTPSMVEWVRAVPRY